MDHLGTTDINNLLGILGGIITVVALVYNLGVRARVYYETRRFDTVSVLREELRPAIEVAVKGLGLATTNFEVAWWNRGHRAAKRIVVDLTCPAPIHAWEVYPELSNDAGAGWKVTRDPGIDGSDPRSIRIEQDQLMPSTGCRLIIGYDREAATEPVRLQIYVHDRRVSQATRLRGFVDFFGVMFVFAFAFGIAILAAGTPYMKSLAKRSEAAQAFLFILCFFGLVALGTAAIVRISPGEPPWKRRGAPVPGS